MDGSEQDIKFVPGRRIIINVACEGRHLRIKAVTGRGKRAKPARIFTFGRNNTNLDGMTGPVSSHYRRDAARTTKRPIVCPVLGPGSVC